MGELRWRCGIVEMEMWERSSQGAGVMDIFL